MKVLLNERMIETAPTTVDGLRSRFKPDADIFVLNGFPAGLDATIKEGDRVTLIRRGEIPTIPELEVLMMARHTPGVHEKLKGAIVGIAGIGGLGSHVAIALARTGVGKLVIADMDVVEPSNMNRQAYTLDDIGSPKVEALQRLLLSINPFVAVEPVNTRLTRENAPEVFRECHVVVEALDMPQYKAPIIEGLLTAMPSLKVVGASGVAGFGPGNDIKVERIGRLFICGDRTTEAGPGVGLMAPRVMIAAGQQANQVLRLLLGEDG